MKARREQVINLREAGLSRERESAVMLEPREVARRELTDAILKARHELRHTILRARREQVINLREAGLSYAAIGRKFGLSRERIRQIDKQISAPKKPKPDSEAQRQTDEEYRLGVLLDWLNELRDAILRARHEQVINLRKAGLSYGVIGRRLGLSGERVRQIDKQGHGVSEDSSDETLTTSLLKGLRQAQANLLSMRGR